MAGAGAGGELRDSLITTAVKFLTNPNIQRCPLESKEKFLRGKGLTEPEIASAIDKACELMNVKAFTTDVMLFQNSRRSWFRENVLPIVIYGGFAYGVYWFYKNCIQHLIFVERPRSKSTAECLDDLRKSMDALNSSVEALKSEVQAGRQLSLTNAVGHQLDNIKSDISSVKGLLLSRNQFPSLKTRTAPSIPAWQRQSEEATSTEPPHGVEEAGTAKPHRPRSQRSESGGSNSSEGEQAAKNSDSSLEIIT